MDDNCSTEWLFLNFPHQSVFQGKEVLDWTLLYIVQVLRRYCNLVVIPVLSFWELEFTLPWKIYFSKVFWVYFYILLFIFKFYFFIDCTHTYIHMLGRFWGGILAVFSCSWPHCNHINKSSLSVFCLAQNWLKFSVWKMWFLAYVNIWILLFCSYSNEGVYALFTLYIWTLCPMYGKIISDSWCFHLPFVLRAQVALILNYVTKI